MKKGFKLVTECTFQAPAREVWDVTVDVIAYPEWWPYIHNVAIRGKESRLQQDSRIDYEIKGFLPHSLRFHTHVTLCEPFSRIEMIASGDLEGTGKVQLRPFGFSKFLKFTMKPTAKLVLSPS